MDILISINPQWVDKIVKGEKKYEFRKTKINLDGVNKFFIYSTSPVKKIVAAMTIEKIIEGPPEEIWEKYGYTEGSKEDFLKYYVNKKMAYALSIKEVKLLDSPVNPYKIIKKFTPPMSYYYLKDEALKNALS